MPACSHDGKTMQCAKLTPEDVGQFFERYHALPDQKARHAFLIQYVTLGSPKRRRPRPTDDPTDTGQRIERAVQVRYFVPHDYSCLIQTCRTTFMNILSISSHMMTRVFKHYFVTGVLPVDGRGGHRKRNPEQARSQRRSVLEFLNSFRDNELMTHGDGALLGLKNLYCVKSLWENYNDIADPEVQVALKFFRTIFAENFDLHLNPKQLDVVLIP